MLRFLRYSEGFFAEAVDYYYEYDYDYDGNRMCTWFAFFPRQRLKNLTIWLASSL